MVDYSRMFQFGTINIFLQNLHGKSKICATNISEVHVFMKHFPLLPPIGFVIIIEWYWNINLGRFLN